MAKPKVVFLPIPTVGHMMSMVEMAKLLLHHHPGRPANLFSVTILVPGKPYTAAVEAYICSVAESHRDIQFHPLPHVDPPTHYDGPEDYISIQMEMRNPQIKSALSDLRSTAAPVAALVIDFFSTTAIDITTELGIPCYVYYATGAAFLALMLYLPTLHDEFPMEFEEMKAELSVPGLCQIPRRVRAKAEEMMVLGRRAREEGGSSFGSMERLVKELLGRKEAAAP